MLESNHSLPTPHLQIAAFIESDPEFSISDSPIREWVLWDSGSSVSAYCRRISSGGAWGGGIEMAVTSQLKKVNVHVYQSTSTRGGGGRYYPLDGGRGASRGRVCWE